MIVVSVQCFTSYIMGSPKSMRLKRRWSWRTARFWQSSYCLIQLIRWRCAPPKQILEKLISPETKWRVVVVKPLDKSLDSEKVRSPSPKTGGSEKLSDENTKEPSVSTSSSPPEVQDDEDKSHSSPKVDKDKQPPSPKPKSESVRMGRDKEIPHAIGTWSMRTRKNNKVCATEVTQYTCIQPNRERNKSTYDIISDSKLKG